MAILLLRIPRGVINPNLIDPSKQALFMPDRGGMTQRHTDNNDFDFECIYQFKPEDQGKTFTYSFQALNSQPTGNQCSVLIYDYTDYCNAMTKDNRPGPTFMADGSRQVYTFTLPVIPNHHLSILVYNGVAGNRGTEVNDFAAKQMTSYYNNKLEQSDHATPYADSLPYGYDLPNPNLFSNSYLDWSNWETNQWIDDSGWRTPSGHFAHHLSLSADSTTLWQAFAQKIHLFPGKKYTYSFWLWQTSGSKPISILYSFADRPQHGITYFNHVDKYEQWVKVVNTFTVDQEDNYRIRVENSANPTSVYIGDIKLEQGDKATTYIG